MNSQDSLFSSSSSVKTEAFSSPSLTEEKQKVENFTWIQCDNVNCQKWRKIPANEGDHFDDVDWFCYMNSDPEYNSCDAVEEDYTAYDRLARKLGFKYVMSCLPVGSLVWAQSTGYCRWPALVTVDPQYHYHYEVDRDGDPYRYHVEYLGKNHCHAWIPAMRVTLYGHKEDTCQDEQKNKPVKSSSRKWKKKKKLLLQMKSQRLEVYKKYTVTEAIREADLLIPLTVEERLEAACQFKESNFRQPRNLETKEENGRSSSMTRESKCKKTQGAKRGHKRSSQPTADRKNDREMKNSIERSVKSKTTSLMKREGKRRSEENHESRTKYSTKRSNLSVEERVPNPSSAKQSMYEDTALTMTCSDTDEKNIDMFRFEDLEMNNSLLNRSQEERFAINVQQYKRNEQAFDHDLHRFMLRNGLQVQTKTTWHHTKVGLFQLFMAVFERGGYQKLRFHGTKTGRRLLRSRFRSCCEELQELDSVSSNAEFLNVLKNSTANIGPKRSPGPTAKKRKSQPQLPVPSNVPLPSETTLSPEQVIVADKKVGEFNVSLERLSMAPQEFRCRDVDTKWASEIKNSIRNAPGSIITTLPALLDPSVIADPSEFKAETVKDVNIKMFLLGGNHLTSACRQLLLEEPDNEIFSYYRHVNIELYVGLTPEEAKLVGNVHNRATSSKSILFQDLVRQARSIYIRDETGDKWKDTATVVLSHIQQKKCSKDSLWVVFSVAAYGTEAYTEAERIFNLWDSVEVPQHLFKALMGMEEEVRCQYLRRVEVRPDLKKITNDLKTEKKRTILKEVFMEKTKCSSWEEAEETYEPYVHMVDDYLDFNINRRCVPTEFVKFCDAAKEHRAMESVDISVDINLTSRTHQDLINHNSIKSLVTSTKRKLEDRVRQILKKIKPDD